MFSSVLLLFGLAAICQYVVSSKKIWQNNKIMAIGSKEKISNVLLQDTSSGMFFCGGNLINNAYVLTAAECVVSRRCENVTVCAGLQKLSQEGCEIARPIREIIIHEEYDRRNPLRYDIALLRLKNIVIHYPSDNIRFVRVPTRKERRKLAQIHMPKVTHLATVSGYGIISENQPSSFIQMVKSNTFIYDSEYCQRLFKKIDYISNSHICAHDPFVHTNFKIRISDVGGPLIFDSTVVGIALSANWDKQYPLLFTNVSSYWEWIHLQVKQRKNRTQ